MTTSQDLLTATVAALIGDGASLSPPVFATDCGNDVFQPGDWPTQDGQYPRIKARLLSEQKTSLGRAGINFTVTGTVRIVVEVSKAAQLDDIGATQAEQDLWNIVRQVEVAMINSYPLMGLLQQFPTINTQLAFTSEQATHLAGAQIDVAMEFYQGAEDFAPIASDAMDEMDVTVSTYSPTGATIPLT